MNRNQVLNVWVPRLEYGLAWARLHLIAIAVCYCLIYIGQVTRTNSLGGKLSKIVVQRDQLYYEVEALNAKVAQAGSIKSIQAQGLELPQSVLYAK